jgi:CRISPR system Cascade subunit CasC
MTVRFLQIHFLTSYSASLLNRDDVGFAKRIPFGGATRTRISSQCQKRHWRTFDGEQALSRIVDSTMSVRSRQSFVRFVYEPLLKDGIDEKLASEVTAVLMSEILGESAKAKKKKAAGEAEVALALDTSQLTVLGRPELDYFLSEARAVCAQATTPDKAVEAMEVRLKAAKGNLQAMKRGSGLDAALFGRMVTSDVLARCDAALHVAHAFTVHAEAAESDYFSAVDDLLQTGDDKELGSGHIGTTELTSGLFYGYVVADVPLLLSNLGHDLELAGEVIERLVHLVATVSPGAKLGSTAPHSYAQFVLAEAGRAQPRTLANAFLAPVRERPDLLANTYQVLADHLAEIDTVYGAPDRQFVALGPKQALSQALAERANAGTLDKLAAWSAAQVRSEQ